MMTYPWRDSDLGREVQSEMRLVVFAFLAATLASLVGFAVAVWAVIKIVQWLT